MDYFWSEESDSVRSFEFTKGAEYQLRKALESFEYQGNDSAKIYEYLMATRAVPFHAYLKRWLYKEAEIPGRFSEVADAEYQEIILQSFREHRVPFSRGETARKPSAIVKDWLSRGEIRRTSMLHLGYGLGMTDAEVSEFLMKALHDTDFDFYSPEEVLDWYCFHTGGDYQERQRLAEEMDRISEPDLGRRLLDAVAANPREYLFQENMALRYAAWLRGQQSAMRSDAFRCFLELYEELGRLLGTDGHPAGLIERNFCMGIPRDANGNLQRMADSGLDPVFRHYSLNRQRLSLLAAGKTPVSRQDLITLIFFRACLSDAPGAGSRKFVKDCTRLLAQAHMSGLYFCSPYEAFLLLAISSDEPLDVYSEVWEMSYAHTEKEISE